MLKKIVIGAAAATLLGVFLFGTSFFGYMGTMVDDVKTAANDAVPFEMKIKEAKRLVNNLGDAVQKQKVHMAQIMTQQDRYKANVKNDTEKVAQLQEELEYLAGVVEGADSESVYVNTTDGKQKRTVAEVKNKMTGTLASFKLAKRSLETNKLNLDRENQKYHQAETLLTELEAKKNALAQRIKELEALKAEVETRQAVEASKFDDSAIQEAEAFLNGIEDDLATQRNLLDIEQDHGTFEVQPNAPEEAGDILDEVKKALDENKNNELISTET